MRSSAQPIITTPVGSDLFFQGNGMPATSVPLGRVQRVSSDPSGRPVFADPNYNLVFRVNSDGTIQTIAGNNVQGLASAGTGSGGGYSGDGGPATSAALNRPQGTVYDSQGNLYIADTYNNMVRMVSSQGIISRFAGTGVPKYSGDSGSALNATMIDPTDLAIDASGNLYIYDGGNGVIRKVSAQGTISTVAGTAGTAGCSSSNNVPATSTPIGIVQGMAVDSKGNLYFSECARVREVSGGTLSTVPWGSTTLVLTAGLAFDPSGNLLIVDQDGQRIYKLAAGALTVVAGTGQSGFSGDGSPAASATFQDPFGLAVTNTGQILVADLDNLRVRQINSQNVITTIASNGALISGQNGVSAPLAALYNPFGINFDASGRLLIADTLNNIVRRMTGQTLATVAGTGAGADTGNTGQATQSPLANPVAVTANLNTGDLFISENGRFSSTGVPTNNLRKVASSGIISTLATLNSPYQTVVDSAGNLYAADFWSGSVVKISPSGAQQAVITGLSEPAGLAIDASNNLYVSDFYTGSIWRYASGFAGYTSTSTPLAKNLNGPAGLALDSKGNLYFAEFLGNTVRVVAPNGSISLVAGNGTAGFSGDNGPATAASLSRPFSLAFDPSGSLYIADVGNNRIRQILMTSAPTFSADSAAVTLPQANSNGPVTQPVVVNVSATLNGAAFPGLLFSVSADQPWLEVTASAGAMPAQLLITADPTGLAPATYAGNVVINAPGANPSTLKVAVSFTVAAVQPARLCFSPRTLSFAFGSSGTAQTATLSIQNAGSGTGNYSIATCGAPWLAISPAQGTVAANSPASVSVTVTPGQLNPGTSFCNLTVTGGGYCDPSNGATAPNPAIGVSASINAVPAKLLLSQTGIAFPALAGGGAPLPRSFGVLNIGGGQMAWAAAVSTTSGGPWLSVSPTSGTVTTPFTGVSQVTVAVNPAGLGANLYYGSVTVNAAGLPPQSVTIVLNVQAPGTASAVDIYPAGLVFNGVQGTNPSSQAVSIANLSSGQMTFTSSRLAAAGDPQWFVQTPTSAAIAPNQPINLVVQPDFSTLSAGVHQGTIALRFSDGSTGNVTVQSVLQTSASPPTGSAESPEAFHADATICNLTPVALGQQPVVVSQGSPTTLQVQVSDTCNNQLNSSNTTVTALFPPNSDPVSITLNPGSTPGVWEGTWTPAVLPASANFQIQMNVNAAPANYPRGESSPFTINATIKSIKTVSTTPAPTILSGGVVNAASYAAGVALAPCSLVSIYGNNLANGTDSHLVAPLPTTLADTELQWSGQPLSLLATTTGQINAQVPCGLNTNTQLQIAVNRSGVLSDPNLLPMADYSPAIFTADASGQGQGSISDYGPTGLAAPVINSPDVPAHVGNYITIYCTGLGAVNPAVPTGQPAGATPPSQTLVTPTVTIGGINAPVSFSGMTPGFAGLYQVNVTVPPGVTPGSQVPVALSIGNLSTSQYQNVTIAVQ